MNQHRALKTPRGSCDGSWTLLKSFHQLSWDQNGSLSLGWPQLFLWVQIPPDGLSRIFCGWINEDSGPRGAKRTQRPIEQQQWWLSWAQECHSLSLSRAFCARQRKKWILFFCCPSSLSRMVFALRTNEIVSWTVEESPSSLPSAMQMW